MEGKGTEKRVNRWKIDGNAPEKKVSCSWKIVGWHQSDGSSTLCAPNILTEKGNLVLILSSLHQIPDSLTFWAIKTAQGCLWQPAPIFCRLNKGQTLLIIGVYCCYYRLWTNKHQLELATFSGGKNCLKYLLWHLMSWPSHGKNLFGNSLQYFLRMMSTFSKVFWQQSKSQNSYNLHWSLWWQGWWQ